MAKKQFLDEEQYNSKSNLASTKHPARFEAYINSKKFKFCVAEWEKKQKNTGTTNSNKNENDILITTSAPVEFGFENANDSFSALGDFLDETGD